MTFSIADPARLLALAIIALGGTSPGQESTPPEPGGKPNILLIVADDLNWDSLGFTGCSIEGLTPNVDRLAAEGLRFEHAHVNISACWPSRHSLLSGRYPHRSGGEGFAPLRLPDVPILPALLRDGGYRVGVIGKTKHSTPYSDFEWDLSIEPFESGQGRSPKLFAECLERIIEEAEAAEQPFFLMANSHDPHRPFFGQDKASRYEREKTPPAKPTRRLEDEEVDVPPFLPDLPGVRADLRAYFESVGRCDETVGALLSVLAAEDLDDETVVIFLSDNGMAFPFVKANCYRHSTKTPLIVRWPGHCKEGAVRGEEVISGVDLMPTLLELAKVALPEGLDGTSFLPTLRGNARPGQEYAFTQYYGTTLGDVVPMRSVQGKRFGYNFNPWADGETQYLKVEYFSTPTMTAMGQASLANEELSARIMSLIKRTPEEFFDYERDPHGLHNAINDPEYEDEVAAMRDALEAWMVRFEDPALEAFRRRDSPEALGAYVDSCRRILGGGNK